MCVLRFYVLLASGFSEFRALNLDYGLWCGALER